MIRLWSHGAYHITDHVSLWIFDYSIYEHTAALDVLQSTLSDLYCPQCLISECMYTEEDSFSYSTFPIWGPITDLLEMWAWLSLAECSDSVCSTPTHNIDTATTTVGCNLVSTCCNALKLWVDWMWYIRLRKFSQYSSLKRNCILWLQNPR